MASCAWVVCRLKRLVPGRRQLRRSGSCAELRLAACVARLIGQIWPGWEMKCGCEHAQTCLYSVQTYINIYVHVCTMYIQRYTIMYIHVHVCIFMYMYIAFTYMFILVHNFINMYIHVCIMYRALCTDLQILVYVVRIPDVLGIPDVIYHIDHTSIQVD